MRRAAVGSAALAGLVGLASLAAPVAARADDADGAGAAPRPLLGPALSGATSAGVEWQVTTSGMSSGAGTSLDATVHALDAIVEVAVTERLVVVSRLPVAHASLEATAGPIDCCGWMIGNFTIGARWLAAPRPREDGELRFGAEASVSLPTADADDDTGPQLVVASRLPHDAGRYLVDTATTRVVGYGHRATGGMFGQIEAGVHVWIPTGDDEDRGVQTIVRLVLAGGVTVATGTMVLAELTNQVNTDGDAREQAIHALDLGVRWQSSTVTVAGRLHLPLDETFREVDLVGFGLDVAARF